MDLLFYYSASRFKPSVHGYAVELKKENITVFIFFSLSISIYYCVALPLYNITKLSCDVVNTMVPLLASSSLWRHNCNIIDLFLQNCKCSWPDSQNGKYKYLTALNWHSWEYECQRDIDNFNMSALSNCLLPNWHSYSHECQLIAVQCVRGRNEVHQNTFQRPCQQTFAKRMRIKTFYKRTSVNDCIFFSSEQLVVIKQVLFGHEMLSSSRRLIDVRIKCKEVKS